ncbi:hypothetical protein BVC80_1835g218 [Macleaya cordata]|uniref:Far-red elongated hypocotyl 1 n=1 Tax=Macleaya cordata TaxID=56857 RepID=A0A200R561_MACCD|nr:hypothetical protein BVC80_1835g218 [Macleaya cordata]
MEMDENRVNLSHEMNSVLVRKPVYAGIIDFNKKRKLEDDELGLPQPKHKYRDQSSSSEQEEHFFFSCLVKENTDGGVSDDTTKQLESPNASTSFDSAISPYPEAKYEREFLKVYTYNQPDKFGTGSPRTHFYDQPSTSSGSCGNNSFKSTMHSVDKISTENKSIREEESPISREPSVQILKDGLQFDENELPGFGKYTDCFSSEYGTDEIEHCSDMEADEMMLYSNEATSKLYVLSSGRWNINQDARVDTRKPTIDQEFEQYFSMLMM